MYAGGNPISRIDRDGKKWIDVNGDLVWNNGEYTNIATADHRRIGDNLRNTVTGREQFDKLVNHAAPIQTIINTTDARTATVKGKSGLVFGATEKHIDVTDGKGVLTSGIITLYEKNIGTAAEKNGVDINEQLAATTGHEIEHTTEANVQLTVDEGDVEELPKEKASQIIREYQDQQPLMTPNSYDVIPSLTEPRRLFYGGGW
jgi:hypothetical protein